MLKQSIEMPLHSHTHNEKPTFKQAEISVVTFSVLPLVVDSLVLVNPTALANPNTVPLVSTLLLPEPTLFHAVVESTGQHITDKQRAGF